MHTPPPPLDDMQLSNATGILQKKNVVSSGHQSVTPFLSGAPPPKKIPGSALDPLSCLSGRECEQQLQSTLVVANTLRIVFWCPYKSELALKGCDGNDPPFVLKCHI